MYCKKCGSKVEDGELFCSKCGTKAEVPVVRKSPKNISDKLKRKIQESRLPDVVLICLFSWIFIQCTGNMFRFWRDIFPEFDWLELYQKFLGSMVYMAPAILIFSCCIFEITEILQRSYNRFISVILTLAGLVIKVVQLCKDRISGSLYGKVIGNMAEDCSQLAKTLLILGTILILIYYVRQKFYSSERQRVR
ncbi:MAG: zinc-ribbon domain-containing protein [Lachnospiraceae bacterium]